jgi:ATP-dependent helicase Lhr and Lhr-like helicase
LTWHADPEPSAAHAQRALLPDRFHAWFASLGWEVRPHQLALLELARNRQSGLLVAPTGSGKTLAGFLPTLVELSRGTQSPTRRLHTLYISPLKALAVDIARNLSRPVEGMVLGVKIETRTGDTSAARRARQMASPPDILLTTPEQLALMVSHREARTFFSGLRHVVLDELHALVTSKRGDLLALDLARLRNLSPDVIMTGLSATVREPEILARVLVPQRAGVGAAKLITVPGGASARLTVMPSARTLPLAGHTAGHAIREIYAAISAHRLTLVFVNTRMQAEFLFNALWTINDDALPIALHHGSLDVQQRRKVEAAMAQGRLKAVVCTATLDLGIDWGDVDLVINVGAPKGASRLIQRIGRSNHRMDEPSKAFLVPSNRFEAIECQAALEAAEAAAQDTPEARIGALDVLAQHVLGMCCAEATSADALYAEVTSAAPYAALSRTDFDAILGFVATGGYALKAYDRFAKIVQGRDGLWRAANPRVIQQYRMNVGTIVESTMLKVRLGRTRNAAGMATGRLNFGGRVLGEMEEYFAETMVAGDTFLFAGEVLAFQGISGNEVVCARTSAGTDPKIPSYAGGKFPLSTFLAARVRTMLSDRTHWSHLPPEVGQWLEAQAARSVIPKPSQMLVETFPRGGKHYLVAYPFEGRLAHQTLGMLLTRRLERAGLKPLGFVCNDYGLSVWGLDSITGALEDGRLHLGELFAQDMLGDDLDAWLAESALMKRTFRVCAVIAGLIEKRYPGQEKTGRQVTMSTDLVYDVLRRHEPNHVLLRAANADAATGLLDIARLGAMLARVAGRIIHKSLERVSPLAVAVILEIGRESVYGEAADDILAEAEAGLVEEAMK